MGIVEKFIKEGQLTREEYPELCFNNSTRGNDFP